MKNILSDLWSGNICPCEEKLIDSKKERALNKEIEKAKGVIIDRYNITDTELLTYLDDCYGNLMSFLQEESFINGFSLATKIIMGTSF